MKVHHDLDFFYVSIHIILKNVGGILVTLESNYSDLLILIQHTPYDNHDHNLYQEDSLGVGFLPMQLPVTVRTQDDALVKFFFYSFHSIV